MNPTNLGAIFRSAAALGMDAVLLTPACSDPLYRRSARVSMGTVFQVPWTYLEDGWIEKLRAMGFKTAAMALRDDSVSIDDPALAAEEKLAHAQTSLAEFLQRGRDLCRAQLTYLEQLPEMEAAAIRNSVQVQGIFFARPPRRSKLVEPVRYSTQPAQRNSNPLNREWFSAW